LIPGVIASCAGLDLPIGTVKSRIFYAVKSAGKHLKEKGIFDGSY